jgi:mono/diheme cytochrome c family protein
MVIVRIIRRGFGVAVACVAAATACSAQESSEAKSAETFQKICGTCHTPQSVLNIRRTRAQWQETIDKMVGLGAKATDAEFGSILNYLSATFGPDSTAAPGGRGRRGGPASAAAGPDNKHVVDAAAADRGRGVWAAECINCHGTYARGTDNGSNLVRSDLLVHDRYGSELGPFLKKGHPMQSGNRSDTLTPVQVAELSHFLHQRIYDTLRGSPLYHLQNILTGDAKAGAEYFNGAGGCNSCHSVTGDLKGIASRYEAPVLLGRFLFPEGGRGGRGGRGGGAAFTSAAKQVTLTVTPPSGEAVTGVPVVFDDFEVSIRDGSGKVQSWTRTPDLKIVKNNPYAAHEALLQKYTDKNMHDLLAFLVTLQ